MEEGMGAVVTAVASPGICIDPQNSAFHMTKGAEAPFCVVNDFSGVLGSGI